MIRLTHRSANSTHSIGPGTACQATVSAPALFSGASAVAVRASLRSAGGRPANSFAYPGLTCAARSFAGHLLHRLRSSAPLSTASATSEAQQQAATAVAEPPPAPAKHERRVKVKMMGKDLAAATNIRAQIEALFTTALSTAFPAMEGEVPMVAACNQPKNGDYQCNNAMSLFGKLKGTPGAPKAPRDVASALLAALPPNDLIVETSLAGPGFINLRLSKAHLAAGVSAIFTEGTKRFAPDLSHMRVAVDFSSPNVAKEMHVGHLRSTIIGDTIARTLELCGASVLRLNHIGDWGTQFGMLIEHMRELRPEGLGLEGGRDEDVADLMRLYKASKKRFDEDEAFKTRARESVTALQSGDPESRAAWQRICAASRREFQAIYNRLGVTLQERGESFYNPMLKATVDELLEKGTAQHSEGAVCVFVEGAPAPLMVQKSDGGFGYASTDMACIKQRIFEEKADWLVYVTDSGQSSHFELIFAAAKMAGWLDGIDGKPPPRLSHVGFGLVLGEDGKKIKSRSGDSVRLVELLDEAKERCATSIRERRAESGQEIDAEELESSSGIMGYGAVKYADLKNHRMTNYKFSFDSMLDLKGNTSVYLEYAHARIAGIVRKAEKDVDALAASTPLVLAHPREAELALHLCKLPEAIEVMLEEMAPNRITDYVYELSEKFNVFYTECKVLGAENEAERLLLVEATARVMRQVFELLGITPLYRI